MSKFSYFYKFVSAAALTIAILPIAMAGNIAVDSSPRPQQPLNRFFLSVSGGAYQSWLSFGTLHNLDPLNLTQTTHANTRGLVGKISAGVNINRYLGLSIGAIIPSNASVDSSFTSGGTAYGDAHTISRYRAIDMMVDFSWRVHKAIILSASVGAAYVEDAYRTSYSGDIMLHKGPHLEDANAYAVLPTVEVGIGYPINQNFNISINDQLIFSNGSGSKTFHGSQGSYQAKDLSNYIPQFNFTTVGVTYNF